VVVVVEGLHPPVAGLDREATGNALGGEQLVPVFLTVRQAVLQVEGAVSKDLVAVGAGEALGVEGGRHRLQAVLSSHFRCRSSRPRPRAETQGGQGPQGPQAKGRGSTETAALAYAAHTHRLATVASPFVYLFYLPALQRKHGGEKLLC